MERAYASARERGWSDEPIVEMLIPSTVDDSLAPAGQHVASLFCQHFRRTLPDGRSWDDERERAADAVVEQVSRFAPNFRRSIIARRFHTPLDLERDFGLVGGDIFHGKLTLNQLFSARPVLGHGNYRMGASVPRAAASGQRTNRLLLDEAALLGVVLDLPVRRDDLAAILHAQPPLGVCRGFGDPEGTCALWSRVAAMHVAPTGDRLRSAISPKSTP